MSFTITDGQHKRLSDIKLIELDRCPRCKSTVRKEDSQINCDSCIPLEDEDFPSYFNETVKITSIICKKMKYSKGIYFKIEDKNMVSEMVFDNSPLFEEMKIMEEGCERTVEGWVEDRIIEVISISHPN